MKRLILVLVLVCVGLAAYPVELGMLGSEWVELSYEQKVLWLRGVATGCSLMQAILRQVRVLSAPIGLYIFEEVVEWYVGFIDSVLSRNPDLLEADVTGAIFWDEVGVPDVSVE